MSWTQFTMVLAAVAGLSAHPSAQAGDAALDTRQLESDQALAIAVEAQEKYDRAVDLVASDPTLAHELFAESASGFQRLVDSGIENGKLQYNLGNARVQAGGVGRGIAAYLSATALLPGDARIAENLAHARSLVAGTNVQPSQAGVLDRLCASWQSVSNSQRWWLTITWWACAWALIAMGFASKWKAKLPWRTLICGCFAIFALAGATLAVDGLRGALDHRGVLIEDHVTVRKGNGEGFASAFDEELPQGVEFVLTEARPGWYQIELASGQQGWVKDSQALLVGR